ncbi:MAG: type IV pilus modification PilV family protein [Oligoflexus sp.]
MSMKHDGSNPELHQEQGFTLIGVLMSAGILAILAMIGMKFFSNQMAARQQIRTMAASQGLEGAVAHDILSRINQNLNVNAPGCINLATSFQNAVLEGGARYRLISGVQLPASAPSYAKEAANRCRRRRQPSNLTSKLQNQIYFCVAFQSDANSPRDSFLQSRLAFAEVFFEMVDLQIGNPLSCRDYVIFRDNNRINFHGGSALVSYYWMQDGANQQNQFSKSRFLTFMTP